VEFALKQQKTAGQVLVAIKKRCEPGVLDHTSLILNAPGASARTKLLSFVQFIEGRRLCDLSVVTVVQDDIRSLDPITTFADAVDNMIAINLLQEELLMMGQPYSDADLIIQHSNKMPNTENFRALKMEFIDCDVSQFSTSRPSLTHTQPNPQLLRVRKTWDEYCHRIQRFNASDPLNQPKSALSAKMHTESSITEITALAATEEPLDVMMRRIIAEFKAKPTEPNRSYSQSERDAYKRGRQDAQGDRQQYQDRQRPPPPMMARDQNREFKSRQGGRLQPSQGRGLGSQDNSRNQSRPTQGAIFRKFGKESDSRRRRDDRRAYGASSHEHSDDLEDYDQDDNGSKMAFSATQDYHEDENDDDYRRVMMGQRDYNFEEYNEEDEDLA